MGSDFPIQWGSFTVIAVVVLGLAAFVWWVNSRKR